MKYQITDKTIEKLLLQQRIFNAQLESLERAGVELTTLDFDIFDIILTILGFPEESKTPLSSEIANSKTEFTEAEVRDMYSRDWLFDRFEKMPITEKGVAKFMKFLHDELAKMRKESPFLFPSQ